jgi:2-hydroxychromene-2-carboxylate isomerase
LLYPARWLARYKAWSATGSSAPKFGHLYQRGAANQELGGIASDAESAGGFGVPSLVLQGEPLWGADRVEVLKRDLESAGLAPSGAPIP